MNSAFLNLKLGFFFVQI
uniref:Uncharacterized protein n=1 Tax=Anguilla anguilla TaxID=7936 RepID=A0A0E9STW2_ANGAN